MGTQVCVPAEFVFQPLQALPPSLRALVPTCPSSQSWALGRGEALGERRRGPQWGCSTARV